MWTNSHGLPKTGRLCPQANPHTLGLGWDSPCPQDDSLILAVSVTVGMVRVFYRNMSCLVAWTCCCLVIMAHSLSLSIYIYYIESVAILKMDWRTRNKDMTFCSTYNVLGDNLSISLAPLTTPSKEILQPPLCRGGNWVPEKWSYLPKVSDLTPESLILFHHKRSAKEQRSSGPTQPEGHSAASSWMSQGSAERPSSSFLRQFMSMIIIQR